MYAFLFIRAIQFFNLINFDILNLLDVFFIIKRVSTVHIVLFYSLLTVNLHVTYIYFKVELTLTIIKIL